MTAWFNAAWRRVWRRWGGTGVAAVVLVAMAAASAIFVPTFDARNEAIHRQLVAKRASMPRSAPVVEARPDAMPSGYDDWIAHFPTMARNADDLGAIFDSAQRHQIVLRKGDYQLKREAGSPLVQYSATFPVHSAYGALKAFAADVLERLPHAALEELQVSRESAGATELDSVVRFTLVYRNP